jgi:PAS domain S-box-containing protein
MKSTNWPAGNSEMAGLIRTYDWDKTSLGPLSNWDPPLTTTVDLVLRSPIAMVLLWGRDGIMIYNDAYSRFAGKRHPDLLGAKVLEGWSEVADLNREVMAAGLSGRTLSYHDRPLVLYRQGEPEEVWLDLFYSPVVDEAGAPQGVLAIVVETTSRVMAERESRSVEMARRRMEDSLNFALEAGGGVGTWDWDVPNNRIRANAQFARLFSVDPQRAEEGTSIEEFLSAIHPDDRNWVTEKIQDSIANGRDFGAEYRLVQGDGSVRWVYARGRAYLGDAGESIRFPGVAFDITDQKALRSALQQSEGRFRAMFAQAPVGVVLTTRHGQILEANDAFLRMLGRTVEEVTGRDTSALTHPDDTGLTHAFLSGLWSGAAAELSIEKRYIHKDGHIVWARATGTVGRDENGAPAQVIVVIEDITERRRAEQRLQAQYAVSRLLAEATSAETTIPAILREVGTVLEWDRGAFWIVDEEGGLLRRRATWNAPGTAAAAFDSNPEHSNLGRGIGLPGRVWESNAPVWLGDLNEDPAMPRQKEAQEAGLSSGFGFPITGTAGRTMGVLEFFSTRPSGHDQALLQTTAALGRQIGQYLQRKQAQDELRNSELIHRAVLETAMDCIVTIDEQSRIREFNPAAAQTFGHDREAVMGQDLAQLLIPERYRDAHYRGMARYLETGEGRMLNRRIEVPALRANGEEFPIELSITRIGAPGPPLFTAYIRDITTRKQSESMLKERVKLAALGADIGVALTTTNTSTEMLRRCTEAIVKHLDAAFARIWTVDDAGQTLELQASSGIYTHTNGAHARVPVGKFKIGRIAEERKPHLTNDVVNDPRVGDREWAKREGMVAFAGYPLIVEDTLIGVIGLFARHALGSDAVTALESIANNVALGIERKRNELALREARDAAEAANHAKSDFLASMSHELRTPLNAIIGYSEMLQEEAEETGEEAILNDLKKIHSAGQHLLSLISDILDLSKIEAGRMDLFPETFDVGTVLDEVASTVEPLVAKNGNTLQQELQTDLGTMHSDLTKIRQGLFNLLSNAAKFTHEGTITLQASRDQINGAEALRFTVADTGAGISPERLNQLFQPFTQLGRSSVEKQGGTGLGLAITKRFCEMMGGDITVATDPGRGSTFSMLLPRSLESGESAPSAEVLRSQMASNKAVVLVIDDDPAARDLMRRYLTREDIAAVLAGSGEEGIRLARELHPQLITLDVVMPGMDGWAVLQALKSDPELSDIPVIMATVVTERGTGYALGADDYLIKPITREKMSQLLRRHGCLNKPCVAMVVDDDTESREMLTAILQKEGWEVMAAADGFEGLAALSNRTPQIILLDLLMPNMDGFEFSAELQKREDWRRIPVVVVTAKDLTSEDRARLNGQVENILLKGGSTKESLVQQIREMVSKLLACQPESTKQSPSASEKHGTANVAGPRPISQT